MVVALVLLGLLGISLLYNLSSFAGALASGGGTRGSRHAGPRLEEVVYQDNDASAKIALIEIDGIITSGVADQSGYNMVDVVKAQLKRAEEDSRVRAVLLKVDSPGGEVLASDEISQAITEFQDRTRKAVVASMGSLAASGGYYVSVPCRWIVANELTITGSIGVIMNSWNYRGLMDKVGIQPQTYKSGRFKDMLSGSRPPEEITAEERQMMQSLIDETFTKFKSVVRAGRERANDKNQTGKEQGRQLSAGWEEYADGRVLSGSEAFRLGFVDELGGFETAVDRTKQLAGISSANLIQYQLHYDFADLLRIFGQSGAKSIRVEVGLEAPKLQAGKMYFLSPTFLH
jgi:protease-4